MLRPVHAYLAEFTPTTDAVRPPPERPGEADEPAHRPLFAAPEAPDDAAARLEAARAEGRAEAEEDARTALAEALAAARAAFEAEREADRTAWIADTADRLADQLGEGLVLLERALAEKTARVLRPFLQEGARAQALAALASTLDGLVRADGALRIEVTGPADLGEALMRRAARLGPALRFTPGEGADLVIRSDETTIETQLDLWSQRLRADLD